MEEESTFDEKFKKIKEIYDQLSCMIQNNGINLVDDNNLNSLITNLCRKFELKMNSKITFGVIFDGLYKEVTLIDALINENIGTNLVSECTYFVQGDVSKQKITIDDSINDIKTISVPIEKWKPFDNSVLLLSPENYENCFTRIKMENIYDPDVLVLVLKSSEDLQEHKIQSFLSSIDNQYKDGNFILVLNDAESLECTAIDYCDVCYPENLRLFLNENQFKLENRVFKISASKCLRFGVDFEGLSPEDEYLRKNFIDLKKALEYELDINNVIDKFYKNAQVIGESMDALQKTFDEKKLKEVINQCETTLMEKSPEVIEDIQKYETGSLKDVSKIFEDKNNDENEFLRNILKKFMKKKCGNFRNDLEVKIMAMIQELRDKNYNKEVGNMTKNIFFNDYLNEEQFENKIDNFIYNDINKFKVKDLKNENVDFSNYNIENIDLEDLKIYDEKSKNKKATVHYKFLKSSKNTIKEVFKIAMKAFQLFTKSFKKTAEKVVEKVKETIDYTVKISKELHLRHMITECRKMKLLVEDRRRQIRNGINTHMDSINERLIEIDNENLKDDKIGNLIGDLMDNFENVYDISGIKNDLYSYLNSTGSSELSINITEHFAEEYRNKYLTSADIDKFGKQIKEKMDKLYKKIDEKKFYVSEKEDFINIDNENPVPLDQLNIEKIEKRSIKTSEMMMQLQSSTTDMMKLLNEITNKLNEGIDKFILYMKNYSF